MKRCFRCMEKTEEGSFCPHCGHDHRKGQEIPYALSPGSVLEGKYLVGNVLGQGGFGITYIGFDMVLEIKVAIKEYYFARSAYRYGAQSSQIYWSSDPGNMDHFVTEARRMAKLDWMPEIARVRDIFYANNTVYIVMEYVEGVNLKTHLQRTGHMSCEQAVKLMLPVMDALHRIHQAGIVHRDISPDNLMMEPNGKLRILDLGAAGDLSRNNAQATQMVARNGFSPLEQYMRQRKIGPYTDVYAVCATIYYCCTGKMLPDAMSRMDQYMETRKADLELDPVIAPNVAEVLHKGLTLEAKDRIPNMEVLAEQLRRAVERDLEEDRKEEKVHKEEKIQDIPATISPKPWQQNIPEKKLVSDHAGTWRAPWKETTVPEGKSTENPSADKKQITDFGIEQLMKYIKPLLMGAAALAVILCAASFGGKGEKTKEKDPYAVQATQSTEAVSMVDTYYEPEREAAQRNQLTYIYEADPINRTITITGYEGEVPAKLIIPSEINGYTVIHIGQIYAGSGAYIFKECENLTDVVIPEGVCTIGYGLFQGCTNLKNVTIPDSVVTIASCAFSDCTGLEQIVIPNNIMSLGSDVFNGCTSLERITIPEGIGFIGGGAFDKTPWLEHQTEDFLTCGDGLLVKYTGNAADAIIPSTIKSIGEKAFSGNNKLVSVIIPDTVSEIEFSVFEDCKNLETVKLPAGLKELGYFAFSGCSSLKKIVIPGSVENIVLMTFENCSNLSEVTLSYGLKEIDGFAFKNCTMLTTVTIPESVEIIGAHAFSGCTGLKTVKLPQGCQVETNSFPATCTLQYY